MMRYTILLSLLLLCVTHANSQTRHVADPVPVPPSPSGGPNDIVAPEMYVPPPKPIIYRSVERMPECLYDIGRYFNDEFRKFHLDQDMGLRGRVVVEFVINEVGNISDAKVVRRATPPCPLCDTTAWRIIKNMPRWTPGSQSGKFVSVYYTLPVTMPGSRR